MNGEEGGSAGEGRELRTCTGARSLRTHATTSQLLHPAHPLSSQPPPNDSDFGSMAGVDERARAR
eukprot:908134-Rhodomonas_salina.1